MIPVWLLLGLALAPGAASGAAVAPAVEGARLAYIDPGSGSFILQALVAMLAGAAVALKAYWGKIKSFLGRSMDKRDDGETARAKPGDD
jgi:hypothetical protein